MGKAQRRRATRKSHHESATGQPETNGRPAEAPSSPATPPHKPDLPDRHTLHRGVKFGPLFNFLFGCHAGFLLFSLGSGHLGDMTMEHFDCATSESRASLVSLWSQAIFLLKQSLTSSVSAYGLKFLKWTIRLWLRDLFFPRCPLLRDGRDTRITLLAKQGGPIGAYIIASAEMTRL